MRIIKSYVIGKEGLEKDIDGFIRSAKSGAYQFDSKNGSEGLKIIKAYFKFIKEEFEKENYNLSFRCYKKLIFLLFGENTEHDYFNYTDILGRISNFNEVVKDYTISMIKILNNDEIVEEVMDYVIKERDVYFDSFREIIIKDLSQEFFKILEEKVIKKIEELKKEDKCYFVYFLTDLAEMQGNKSKYLEICERFRDIFEKEEFEFMKQAYDEEVKEILKSINEKKLKK